MKSLIFVILFLLFGCSDSNFIENTEKVENPKSDDNKTQHKERIYGEPLKNDIVIKKFDYTTVYMPKDLKTEKKVPFVLLASGWSSLKHTDYSTLLNFIASQGYIAIYAQSPMEYGAGTFINRYLSTINNSTVEKYIDKSKFGVVGHSSGGGIAFKILDYFSKNGYGDSGRFIFSMDPWFAFEMGRDDFRAFPKNSYVIIQQYMQYNITDPRIALAIYNNLSLLSDRNRDYQVYKTLNHGYPMGSSLYSQKQIILKPLDALMDLVFNKNQDAYKYALELGSDNPYQDSIQPVKPIDEYEYKCTGNIDNLSLIRVLNNYNLDYCLDSLVP